MRFQFVDESRDNPVVVKCVSPLTSSSSGTYATLLSTVSRAVTILYSLIVFDSVRLHRINMIGND